MRERTIKAAQHHGILERLQQLEAALMKLTYVKDVDFDVDNYDEIPQVILVPHYDVPVSEPRYYSLRQNTLCNILVTCSQFDLWPSGDAIEDMGEHWYIVRRIGDTWPRIKNRETASENRGCEDKETPVGAPFAGAVS